MQQERISWRVKLLQARRRLLFFVIFALALPLLLAWGAIAIRYSNLPGETLPWIGSGLYLLLSCALFLLMDSLSRALKIFAAVQGCLLIWWSLILPSNDREWSPELVAMPKAEFEGHELTITDGRAFRYKSSQNFEADYFQDLYPLDEIEGMDFIISYWGDLQAFAHTFLSFRFRDGRTLSVSVEVRREKGEAYDPIKGFFKQYELIYVVGDELDMLRLRTHIRNEETYLYPSRLNPEHARLLLTELLMSSNKLHEKPRFYNSFGQNCTTTLVDHMNKIPGFSIPMHRKVLLNGLSDKLAYDAGLLKTDLPFPTLKSCCFISEAAQPLSDDPEFPQKIRAIVQERLRKELQSLKK